MTIRYVKLPKYEERFNEKLAHWHLIFLGMDMPTEGYEEGEFPPEAAPNVDLGPLEDAGRELARAKLSDKQRRTVSLAEPIVLHGLSEGDIENVEINYSYTGNPNDPSHPQVHVYVMVVLTNEGKAKFDKLYGAVGTDVVSPDTSDSGDPEPPLAA